MRLLLAGAAALALPSVALAQDHFDHEAMGHGDPAPAEAQTGQAATDEAAQPDQTEMDHGAMDHSKMDHGLVPASSTLMLNTNSGPISAADAVWGADAMRQSREALYAGHGAQNLFWFQADRLEAAVTDDGEGYLWDLQAYYGGDIHKLWLKSEGEGGFGEGVEDAELQALYSRAIAPFFDLQAGIRQDFTGPERTYAVLGIQGLVPYEFEIDAAMFVSTKGDVTARFEAEYDQRLTQRVILQPRVEAELSAQDIPELQAGSGLTALELGLRLRYEIRPELAPYVGIEQHWTFGDSKRFAAALGDDTSSFAVVTGIRFWF